MRKGCIGNTWRVHKSLFWISWSCAWIQSKVYPIFSSLHFPDPKIYCTQGIKSHNTLNMPSYPHLSILKHFGNPKVDSSFLKQQTTEKLRSFPKIINSKQTEKYQEHHQLKNWKASLVTEQRNRHKMSFNLESFQFLFLCFNLSSAILILLPLLRNENCFHKDIKTSENPITQKFMNMR